MVGPFEFVKDISDRKELWKIAIKVYHKWNIISHTKQHFEMIVVDKETSLDLWMRLATHKYRLVEKKCSNNTINSTLREAYAEKFIKYNQSKIDPNSKTVVMLQYSKVKEEGKYPQTISNTYNVTKLSINEDFKPVNEFMKRCPKDILATRSTPLSSQSQVWSHNSSNSNLTPY